MIDRTLFITGTQRSGTTLLERLLAVQDDIAMLSQPFPFLFSDVKRAFLGGADPYPLGHLFLEPRYERAAFAAFLRAWRTSREELESLFVRMESYSGQYTRFSTEQRHRAFSGIAPTDDFAQVVSSLDRALVSESAQWFGSKETTCEEYVPPFLDRGFRCVIILRDPRDVVASLNHGRGRDYGGALKPTLFNIRQWRKGVAFALAMEEHPHCHHCRYEDLVAEPARELERLGSALGLGRLVGPPDLRDASGAVWRGNSSHGEHGGVGTSSVAIYRDVLPREVAEFIEAACLPELQLLGYDTALTRAEATRILATFDDPYLATRRGMEGDEVTAANRMVEVQRLERVSEVQAETSRRWFIFAEVHAKLRAGFRP